VAYTQAQLDALEAAIAEGALVVKYQDKSVEYRSLNDMLKIRGLMQADLSVNPQSTGGLVYPKFSKGLDCL